MDSSEESQVEIEAPPQFAPNKEQLQKLREFLENT